MLSEDRREVAREEADMDKVCIREDTGVFGTEDESRGRATVGSGEGTGPYSEGVETGVRMSDWR